MLLSDYRKESIALIKWWVFLFCIQFLIFLGMGIFSYTLNPKSSDWWWKYLTFVNIPENHKGFNAIYISLSSFILNLIISILDFYLSYLGHRKNSLELKKSYSRQETIILNKMRKHLKMVLIGILVSLFAHMVHGIILFCFLSATMLLKFFFYKELNYLSKNRTRVVNGKIIYKKETNN